MNDLKSKDEEWEKRLKNLEEPMRQKLVEEEKAWIKEVQLVQQRAAEGDQKVMKLKDNEKKEKSVAGQVPSGESTPRKPSAPATFASPATVVPSLYSKEEGKKQQPEKKQGDKGEIKPTAPTQEDDEVGATGLLSCRWMWERLHPEQWSAGFSSGPNAGPHGGTAM
ncbi:hypothetical protein JOB18_001072 [Solea senegalensis]|uniref:Uncharacterized protein n=1 Tax=Solea senegalensis TaxID=28829 RepID=A0AAV6PMK0_SOLSE|nr:hypothetical protein JOB18_001072 [Solea senegalensis]